MDHWKHWTVWVLQNELRHNNLGEHHTAADHQPPGNSGRRQRTAQIIFCCIPAGIDACCALFHSPGRPLEEQSSVT